MRLIIQCVKDKIVIKVVDHNSNQKAIVINFDSIKIFSNDNILYFQSKNKIKFDTNYFNISGDELNINYKKNCSFETLASSWQINNQKIKIKTQDINNFCANQYIIKSNTIFFDNYV